MEYMNFKYTLEACIILNKSRDNFMQY